MRLLYESERPGQEQRVLTAPTSGPFRPVGGWLEEGPVSGQASGPASWAKGSPPQVATTYIFLRTDRRVVLRAEESARLNQVRKRLVNRQ